MKKNKPKKIRANIMSYLQKNNEILLIEGSIFIKNLGLNKKLWDQ